MTEASPPWQQAANPGVSNAAEVASELDDPATSPERLQQIAAAHSELGSRIASHPNCYPELRQWLGQRAQAQGETQRELASELPPGSAPRSRRLLKAVGVAFAVAVPLITAVSLVITMFPYLSDRQSSVNTLRSTVEPDPFAESEVIGESQINYIDTQEAARVIDWEIPVSAPIETFPLDNTPDEDGYYNYCSPAQVQWLEQHALRGDGMGSTQFDITLHNSATAGASLPLGNIRFAGKEVESEATVRFMCPHGGRGAANYGQPLLIKATGEESLYGEAVGVTGDDVMPEGSPVTLNLAPGEVSAITLTRDESVNTQRRYEGRFVADLLDGSGETVVLADDIVFRRASVEGFYVGSFENNDSNEFTCQSPNYEWASCTLSQAAAVLREAAES